MDIAVEARAVAVDEAPAAARERRLSERSAEFAGQLAVAVWLRKLTEDAASQALRCYAAAFHFGTPREADSLLEALVAEYRRRREQQDLCW